MARPVFGLASALAHVSPEAGSCVRGPALPAKPPEPPGQALELVAQALPRAHDETDTLPERTLSTASGLLSIPCTAIA
jgi:hypothetical protein